MKRIIFNFLALQAIIWTFFFSNSTSESMEGMNYGAISDLWNVASFSGAENQSFISNNPGFTKLTLRSDGTYTRIDNHNRIEEGSWKIESNNSVLKLETVFNTKKYKIVKLTDSKNQTFILKENKRGKLFKTKEYELTRIKG